ncbi:MAG: hypothetical protein WCK77_25805, partial [Verrucomicrobiota bacterium]
GKKGNMDTQKKPKGQAMNLSVTTNPNPKFTITATGIEFSGDLSLAEWCDLGRMLIPLAKKTGFMLGDLINYGSKAYGTKYKEALEFAGLAPKTLRNYATVARRVHPTLREPSLGIEHHAAVAGLESQVQRFWLELAKEHNLTVSRLRKSIQAGRLVTEEEMEDGAGNKQTNHVALINRLVRWLTSETCKAPVEEWDADRREAIKRDFQPLLEILAQL